VSVVLRRVQTPGEVRQSTTRDRRGLSREWITTDTGLSPGRHLPDEAASAPPPRRQERHERQGGEDQEQRQED